MQTEIEVTQPGGRKKKEEGEVTIKTKPLKDNIASLVRQKKKEDDVKADTTAQIKAVAEQCGLKPGVVRKLVSARAGDKFDEKKAEVDQLGIVFEEAGPVVTAISRNGKKTDD